MSKYQCDVNIKLLQGCAVHLANMCKPLMGKAKKQPGVPKTSHIYTHPHSPPHTHMGIVLPADLSRFALAFYN